MQQIYRPLFTSFYRTIRLLSQAFLSISPSAPTSCRPKMCKLLFLFRILIIYVDLNTLDAFYVIIILFMRLILGANLSSFFQGLLTFVCMCTLLLPNREILSEKFRWPASFLSCHSSAPPLPPPLLTAFLVVTQSAINTRRKKNPKV